MPSSPTSQHNTLALFVLYGIVITTQNEGPPLDAARGRGRVHNHHLYVELKSADIHAQHITT